MGALSLARQHSTMGLVFLWLGRLTTVLLFLFWGAFFFEHLVEWFGPRRGEYPPAWVWVSQAFHIAIVVGLGLMLRWQVYGALLTIAASAGFVLSVGDGDILAIVLINLIPIACFAMARLGTTAHEFCGED